MTAPIRGGIIAAGAGSRLRADGWRVPKPLGEGAGLPLIGAVLRNFTAAGVTPITILVNQGGRSCAAARAAAGIPRVAPPERGAALRRDHRDGGGRRPRPGRGGGGGARARTTARMSRGGGAG